jgi:hypothetical protein
MYSQRNAGWGKTPEGILFRKDIRKMGPGSFIAHDVKRTRPEANRAAAGIPGSKVRGEGTQAGGAPFFTVWRPIQGSLIRGRRPI